MEDGGLDTINLNSLEASTSIQDTIIGGNRIATYTNEDGVIYNIKETVTSLDTVGQTLVYTDEAGNSFIADLSGLQTLTVIDTVGQTITYLDENGNTFIVDIRDLESLTTLDTVGQTITYTDEDGNTFIADISQLETTTTVQDTIIGGNRIATYTNEDGVIYNIKETVTSLDTVGQSLVYTDEAGNSFVADLSGLQALTVIDTVGQTITYLDENGNTFIVDIRDLESLTTLDTVGQTITYTDEDGNTFIADISQLETTTTVQDTIIGGNRIATYTNEDGVIYNIKETITSIDTVGQTLVYTDEAGNSFVADLSGLQTLTVIDTVGQTITYLDENGNTFIVDIRDLESLTTLDTVGQTITYTDEDGNTFIADISQLETTTTVQDTIIGGNRIATYTNEDGVIYNIKETITSIDTVGQTLVYTDEAGNSFVADLSGLQALTVIDTVGQTITYLDENGNTFIVDIRDLESLTTLDTVGQTITYTDEDGNTFIADISQLETTTTVQDTIIGGNRIATYTNEDGVIYNIKETVTSLDTVGQTLVYTDEAGNSFVADLSGLQALTVIDTVGQTITYLDENGNTFIVDIRDLESLTTLDTVGQTITYTDEDGNTFIADISQLETTTTVQDTIIGGNRIATYTNEDGVIYNIKETVTSLDTVGQTLVYLMKQVIVLLRIYPVYKH